MTNGHGNGNAVLNRVASWVTIVALGAYVMYIGQWVGAADEKFKSAQTVEEVQDTIKERLTRVEEGVEDLEKQATREHELILDAIRDLKEQIEKLEEDDG